MPEELEIPSIIDIQQLIETYVLPWGINIVMSLAIFVIGKFVVGMLVNFSRKLMSKAKVDTILINFIAYSNYSFIEI